MYSRGVIYSLGHYKDWTPQLYNPSSSHQNVKQCLYMDNIDENVWQINKLINKNARSAFRNANLIWKRKCILKIWFNDKLLNVSVFAIMHMEKQGVVTSNKVFITLPIFDLFFCLNNSFCSVNFLYSMVILILDI